MKQRILIAALCLFLAACGSRTAGATAPPESTATVPPPEQTQQPTEVPTLPPDPVLELLAELTAEQKVGQLFLARCNAETALSDLNLYHLGGLILFGQDFKDQTPESMKAVLASYQAAADLPLLLAVDEEGGTVTRISRYPAFREQPFPSPRESFALGGMTQVLALETEKAALLRELGLNVSMGPVCDLTTDPQAFLYDRSLGQRPETTGEFAAFTVDILQKHNLGSVLKHFPGYGNNDDTHTGVARDSRSLSQLEDADLIPFRYGIRAGCGAILVSHTVVEALDMVLPASLSPAVHTYLRQELGFDGVILTDDLVMEAITQAYGAGEAAVLAVLAGNDLLCSTEYALQYEAVLAAVESGRIPMELVDNAAYRVLQWKYDLGLLS